MKPVKSVKYVIVQDCPVPAKMAPFLRKALAKSGATLESCYRGADAEKLLHAHGKKSQTELWSGWTLHLPGYLPANPPGFSTHELRNDGEAYPKVRSGGKLPWWAVGIDLDNAHVDKFLRVARRRGWKVARTYPHSSGEFHHVNFRKPPVWHRVLTMLP